MTLKVGDRVRWNSPHYPGWHGVVVLDTPDLIVVDYYKRGDGKPCPSRVEYKDRINLTSARCMLVLDHSDEVPVIARPWKSPTVIA